MTARRRARVPAGVGPLTTVSRLLARRHRVQLAAWVLPLLALAGATASAYQSTYATVAARRTAVELAQQNAASTLMYGQLPDPGTPAQMFSWEIGAFLTVLTAVCAVLLAAAVTRAVEDDGSLELFRSCGLGAGVPLRC